MHDELDYDETVDLLINWQGEDAPPPMMRVTLEQAIRTVVEEWPASHKSSALISRDGPDLTSFDEILAIYNRDDFPRPPKADRVP